MIPAEAVEAAAKAMYPHAWDDTTIPFIAHGESLADGRARVQRLARESALAGLEAAAPYMLAALADSRDGDLFRFTWAQREWLRVGAS